MGGKDAKISKDAKSSKEAKSSKDATSSGAKGKEKEVKKETRLGLSYKKDDNFGEWYSEVRVWGQSNLVYLYCGISDVDSNMKHQTFGSFTHGKQFKETFASRDRVLYLNQEKYHCINSEYHSIR